MDPEWPRLERSVSADVEAALRNRYSSFVIDGEAVLFGVDGILDFNGLHSRMHDHEVEFYAFESWSATARISVRLFTAMTFPLTLRSCCGRGILTREQALEQV